MKISACLIILSVAFCWAQSSTSAAQNPEGNRQEVALTKLSPPVYPPLSRQARISGDVRLELKVRPDGSVADLALLSGDPRLAPAAVDSAQKSQFLCKGCSGLTTYPMTYTFDFLEGTGCHDTKVASRVRSPKCVYLWKCGSRLTTDWVDVSRPQEVTESDGHVKVLASVVCVETESSHKGEAQ
jgi:TonB family protein